MSKYIVEIEEKPLCVFDKDTQTYFPRLWRVKGFNSLVFDEEGLSRLEELNSDYINEHYGGLQDEAYQRGLEDGKWKAEDGCDGCKYYEDTSLTNPCSECSRGHVDHYKSLSDPDRIEVGDEVTDLQSGANFVVTHLWKNNHGEMGVSGFNGDCSAFSATVNKVKKTDRHFDIDKILGEMKGNNDK